MTAGQIVLAVLIVAGLLAMVVWRQRTIAYAGNANRFLREVVEEVKKITWPGREELRKATMVILVFVLVVALVIGIMDLILQFLLVRLPGRLG